MALALNPERDLQNMGDKVEDEILAGIAMYFIEDEVIAKIVNVIDFIQGDALEQCFPGRSSGNGGDARGTDAGSRICLNSADSKALNKMKRKANNDHANGTIRRTSRPLLNG